MCRFYLLLAGAVGKRQGISIPYPSPTPLLTPWGNPLRRGISAAAVYRDIGSLYPVQVVTPQFRILFGYLCSALYRSRFSKFRWACIARFSLLGDGRSCLRLRVVLLWSIVGFALTAIGSFLWAGNGMGQPVLLIA